MSADLDLCYTPATELGRLIENGSLSPTELMENCLARIDEVNSRLNCFCFVYPEQAMELARAAQAQIKRDGTRGPLHGVPFAIKDMTPTAGKRTTRGSRLFEHWIPDHDAVVVQRLKAAGGIMVGKTTTPEFAHAGFTASPLWGITRNPWNPERTTGGSSGGSGAAVAAGCVPLAEGTDMGGSVRIPAAWCGIVGLKPALGRIPMDILPTVFDNISHFGPLTRTVADCALFLNATAGQHPADIGSIREPFHAEVPPADDVRGLRVALSTDLGYYDVDGEVLDALGRTADTLRDAGAVVTEVDLGWMLDATLGWNDLWAVYMDSCFLDRDLDDCRDLMDPGVVELIEHGRTLSAVAYKNIEKIRTRQWHRLAGVFGDHDILLCPTMRSAAPDASLVDRDFPADTGDGRCHQLDMCGPFNNVAQCPAISVPAGLNNDGMPLGAQLVGPPFDEHVVLRAAAALEKVTGWPDWRPPV